MPEIDPISSGSEGDVPLITIGMPIYNAGRYLRLAVVSILQQTLTNWELIIIDDGSTDGATENIRDLVDPRIKIVQDGSNRGLAARLNEAVDMARGRYFARMDQDDISYPERLARQLQYLEQQPDLDLVASRCVSIDADNKLVGAMPWALTHDQICARPWAGFYLPHPTWMGRIEWFRRHRYATPQPYGCEDQEVLLRSYCSSQFATHPDVLFAYRVRTRINWRNLARARKTLVGIQLRYFLGKRQYFFGFLATFAFITRVAMDTLNLFGQPLGNFGIHRNRAGLIDENDELKWRTISDHLA